jgi:Fic family protein
MAYHWEREDWPNFRYNQADILPAIAEFKFEASQLIGAVAILPGGIQLNARSALQLEE